MAALVEQQAKEREKWAKEEQELAEEKRRVRKRACINIKSIQNIIA